MRVRRLAWATVLVAAAFVPGPASGQSAAPTCEGRPATIVGTDRDDELTGTPGDDVIAGLGGQDTIDGAGGDDVLCGDAGADVVVGGPGADRLFGGDNGLVPQFEDAPEPGRDRLVPGPGDDLVDLGVNTVLRDDGYNSPDTIDYSASATGVTVDLVSGVGAGEGNDTVVVAQLSPVAGAVVEILGSGHPDHLLGTEGPDQLVGNGGGDWIEGRGGDDLLMNAWDAYEYDGTRGESYDDHFDGGAGDDFLDSTGGTDLLLGGDGKDHVRKEGGTGTLDGGAGRDELEVYLSPGRHRLVGGPGRDEASLDVLRSGARARGVVDHSRERFVVRLSHRRPVRAAMIDVERVVMPVNPGRWTYLGTPGDDRVVGSRSYTAKGRGGDDVLIGSYADDVLLGGAGRDRVVGGRGEDRCRGEDLVGCERRRAF